MKSHHSSAAGRTLVRTAVILSAALVIAPAILTAQTVQPKTVKLSLNDAVKTSLDNSDGLAAAIADLASAKDKVLEAQLQQIPSVQLSGAYTRLSDTGASSWNLGAFSVTIPASPVNSYNFAVNVKYPVFAGFRIREAAKIAELQSAGKQEAVEMVRNSLEFEVRRAYWQAALASDGVSMASKNRDLVETILKEVRDEVTQGLATQSDMLTAEDRYNQAQLMLTDALSGRNQAFLALASFMGNDETGAMITGQSSGGFDVATPPAYTLTSEPSKAQFARLDGTLDVQKLISDALANRPETRSATVGVETARHAEGIARAGLYPTLAVVGNYTYANPNQRIFPSVAEFKGTWNVGVAMSFDVGKLPATIAGASAAEKSVNAAQAQAARARSGVLLDVRTSIVAFEQARQDVDMTQGMVKQAEESLRVTQEKYQNGLAKHSDVLQAEVALLRARYEVTSKQVKLRIAGANLARATAMDLQ